MKQSRTYRLLDTATRLQDWIVHTVVSWDKRAFAAGDRLYARLLGHDPHS